MTAPTAGWLHKATPEHRCILPRIDNQTFVGSVWRCGDCGQDYEVVLSAATGSGPAIVVASKALLPISREAAEAKIARQS